MIGRYLVLLALCASVVIAGCTRTAIDPPRNVRASSRDSGKKRKTQEPGKRERLPAPRVETDEPNPLIRPSAEAGVIRGRVTWKGKVPAPRASAEECWVTIHGQKVRVSPPPPVRVDTASTGVAGVMAWLVEPPSAGGVSPGGEDTVRLQQARGVYRPAVQFAAPGSVLQLRTTDDEADFQGSGAVRFSRFLKRGERLQLPLRRTGLVVVRSEDRPGLAPAYIRVVDHAYHAVTGKDGRFELPAVPRGDYELMLWHPGWSKDGKPVQLHLPLVLAEGKGATIAWTLGQ